MPNNRLIDSLENHSQTLLQVESVSRGAVHGAIQVANEVEREVILRVLPEQVGADLSSGGYLGFRHLADFVDHVSIRDTGGFVSFCRAGFAHLVEGANSLSDVKRDLCRDLDTGISFFHVDASKKRGARRSRCEEIALTVELMTYISVEAASRDLEVIFEVGGGGALANAHDVECFADYLDALVDACEVAGIDSPKFAAAWTGCEIKEFSNVASGPSPFSFAEEAREETMLAESADIAGFRGISLVAHDCDYLGRDFWRQLYGKGIAIACVGEELGVHETKVFLKLCDATRSASIRQDFLAFSLASGVWRESVTLGSTSTESEKAILAAHKLFATETFSEIKMRLERRCGAAGISLDQALCEAQSTRLVSLLRHLGSRFEVEALIH